MSDWQEASLADLADYINGKAIKPEECSSEQGMPIIRIKQINDPESIEDYFCGEDLEEKNIARNGDLLFSWSATLKTVLWQGPAGAVNQHIFKVLPKDGIDKIFLHYLIDHSIPALTEESHGSTMKHIKKSALSAFHLQIPPLPEQKKIAEILSGVDTTIAKLKLQAQKLDALRFFLAEELAEVLHSEGELSALQDIAEIRTGIAKNSNSEGDLVELPYMRVANVQDGYLDLSEIKTISVDRGRIARYLLQKGDVLINEGGDLDKVGRGVIWHEEIRECLHQNHVFAVRCSQRLMPEFLSLLLKTTHSKNYFLGCAKQTTNLASINSAQLKSFPIPLPSLDAQNEFINHITSIKQLTSSVSRKISSLAAMKNAISSDLLSGRKRVTL